VTENHNRAHFLVRIAGSSLYAAGTSESSMSEGNENASEELGMSQYIVKSNRSSAN
jgi:hypothetical protein